MHQIPAQKLAIFFLQGAVQIVIMTARSLSSDSDHGCQKSELVYLLTYSKADAKKFPLCRSFSSAVTKTLAQTGA